MFLNFLAGASKMIIVKIKKSAMPRSLFADAKPNPKPRTRILSKGTEQSPAKARDSTGPFFYRPSVVLD